MRLIDADALKEKLRYSMLFKMGFLNHCADAGQEIPEEKRKQIMDSIDLHEAFIKLIDEQPERTGKWIQSTGMMPPEYAGYVKCDRCGEWAPRDFKRHMQIMSLYCPNCGAKMRKEGKEL